VAKRPIKIAKQKAPRQTKAQIRTIDLRFNGSEPIDVSIKGYTEALNWYNYEFDHDKAREWLLEYMKKNNFGKTQIANVRKSPKYAVPTTVGWQARMMMNGNELSGSSMSFFRNHLDRLVNIETEAPEEESKTPTATVSVFERTQVKIKQLMTDCEEAIDNDPNLNIYEWLLGKEASIPAATAIRDYYALWIDDFEPDELDSREQKKSRAEQKKYWESFVADCDRFIGNKKVTRARKTRVKKTKSAVDLVKKMSYQKEFPELKIVSVNPADIIGSSQLWTYNTKYRKLTRYDASGPAGIQVKGTTLMGIDTETSVTKRVRKPEDAVAHVLGAGKVSLRKIMDEIKTQGEAAKTRINNDTILLRVIK